MMKVLRHAAILAAVILGILPAGADPLPTCMAERGACDPVPTYNAFGFAAVMNGHLFVIARRGLRHQDDPTGRVAIFEPLSTSILSGADYFEGSSLSPYWNGTPGLDVRNLAGGVTPDGRLVFFWAERDEVNGIWANLVGESLYSVPGSGLQHSPSTGAQDYSLPHGDDIAFCPYGPLVSLPSGRLVQTVYGIGRDGSSSIKIALGPNTDASWDEVLVSKSRAFRPTEAAIVSLGGNSDAVTKLLMVARTEYLVDGTLHGALREFVSVNGGRSWSDGGEIPVSRSSGQVMPWIARLPDGRLFLVWADRGSLSIKTSIVTASEVFWNPRAWPAPREIYRSTMLAKPSNERNLSDFGYPSVAFKNGMPVVAFYDSTLSLSNDRSQPSGTTIFAVPGWGANGEATPFIPVR